ncbi:hypothetical protein COO60DRAFT_202853 [Scenedesmus sp. NREL 46B-D3]|nr:hypothetical protein COO60DRAFT_202853 [Scenedesmus sp. NREL 46B-D3]
MVHHTRKVQILAALVLAAAKQELRPGKDTHLPHVACAQPQPAQSAARRAHAKDSNVEPTRHVLCITTCNDQACQGPGSWSKPATAVPPYSWSTS